MYYLYSSTSKTFKKRINLNGNLCDACFDKMYDEKAKLEDAVKGYNKYAIQVFGRKYSNDEMRQIIVHRENIINKYRNTERITIEELKEANRNSSKLSEEQAIDVLKRAWHSSYTTILGAVPGDGFFMPLDYEKMIVDSDDVFAVGYTTDTKIEAKEAEAILCVVFTNDPYVPAFSMVYAGKMGFFDFSKSKKGREGVAASFELSCKNLSYPVCDLKILKKQLKQDGMVQGNLDLDFMLRLINEATYGGGIFNSTKKKGELNWDSEKLIMDMGYISEQKVEDALELNGIFAGRFWRKLLQKL